MSQQFEDLMSQYSGEHEKEKLEQLRLNAQRHKWKVVRRVILWLIVIALGVAAFSQREIIMTKVSELKKEMTLLNPEKTGDKAKAQIGDLNKEAANREGKMDEIFGKKAQ